MHGGAIPGSSPGKRPGGRTAAGLARMIAVKTTHGRFAMSGAARRLAQSSVRTLVQRIALTDQATQLRAYLPAGMAARLDAVPEE
jgi:hypothetical protein